MSYSWVPGLGPCENALYKLKNCAVKPDYLMGEAWFMGEERRMFHELDSDIATIPLSVLEEAFAEIASGASAFGLFEEWEVWFDYLLPRVFSRFDEISVSWPIEVVCTAFAQVDLNFEDRATRVNYNDHILRTLGRVLMSSHRWRGGKIVLGKILHASNSNPAKNWGWGNVSGDLAATLIVCMRLIKERDIQEWVDSLFAIECPYWRAQLLTWYIGARPLLQQKIHFPGHFDGWAPRIGWEWSHVITGIQGEETIADSFFPDGNVATFKAAFETNLKKANLAAWKKEIIEIDALQHEVGTLIRRFEVL